MKRERERGAAAVVVWLSRARDRRLCEVEKKMRMRQVNHSPRDCADYSGRKDVVCKVLLLLLLSGQRRRRGVVLPAVCVVEELWSYVCVCPEIANYSASKTLSVARCSSNSDLLERDDRIDFLEEAFWNKNPGTTCGIICISEYTFCRRLTITPMLLPRKSPHGLCLYL